MILVVYNIFREKSIIVNNMKNILDLVSLAHISMLILYFNFYVNWITVHHHFSRLDAGVNHDYRRSPRNQAE